MAGVVLLAIMGMVSSMVIAQINRGMATAVNQSGTLRMQSYRVGVALADARLSLAQRQDEAKQLADEYGQRLLSPRLTDALPSAANDPVRLAYERVRWRWVHEMRRAVAQFVDAGPDTAAAGVGRAAYLDDVDDFVEDIHGLVRVLEERAEQRIELLRWIQTIALVLTVALVLVTLVVVQRRIVAPLGELLRCADRARTGDFSARTRFAGADELGRLGSAMNLMAEGLSQIYNELEDRVAEKTRDLARTNHSLQLLYRTSRTLDESPFSETVLRQVLQDVRSQLHLAGVALCLREGQGTDVGNCIGTKIESESATQAKSVLRNPTALDASQSACRLCAAPNPKYVAVEKELGGFVVRPPEVGQRLFDFPVGDQERSFGLLRVAAADGQRLESWQRPLLQSLAGHVATVLDLRNRMREGRRLVLYEERSILARELHDSLAQSLTYLKIQITRLDAALKRNQTVGTVSTQAAKIDGDGQRKTPATPEEILGEIRTGVSSAYRELRELLTTFRLKMDGRGLGSALVATAEEFRERGDLIIELTDRMPADLLSPNEEVHVLQIVREALSNCVRHASAQRCQIDLALEGGEALVIIADDGVGFDLADTLPDVWADVWADVADDEAHAHYGTTIMRERAQSLDGGIETESRPGVGTSVKLRFRPRLLAAARDNGLSPSLTDADRTPGELVTMSNTEESV